MTDTLTLARPDDWHLHLRDGAMLSAVCPESARHFARAINMPNLVPPVVTGAEAVAGSTRLKAATAQKICLNMISTLVMTRLGLVRDGQMIAMKPGNAKLRERYAAIHGGEPS